MFGFGPATRIYVAAGATDMRKISMASTAWFATIWVAIQKVATCLFSRMRDAIA